MTSTGYIVIRNKPHVKVTPITVEQYLTYQVVNSSRKKETIYSTFSVVINQMDLKGHSAHKTVSRQPIVACAQSSKTRHGINKRLYGQYIKNPAT